MNSCSHIQAASCLNSHLPKKDPSELQEDEERSQNGWDAPARAHTHAAAAAAVDPVPSLQLFCLGSLKRAGGSFGSRAAPQNLRVAYIDLSPNYVLKLITNV